MAARIERHKIFQDAPPNTAFTEHQIQHYLRHISFPLSLSQPRDARFLQTLHRCQITHFPYENLSLHYNPSHSNSIDPRGLYAKFLPDFSSPGAERSRGRGGFCFETCVFFLHILRGLGFTAYPASARIRIRDHITRVPSGPFVGPRHVVNLVLLDDGSIWSCDVGFGGDGPTSPLLLSSLPGEEPRAVNNLGAQEVRLRKGVTPDTVREEANRVWFYEYRNSPTAEWNTYYAFGEAEASSSDLECCNFWVANHPESFQRKQVLAVKFLTSRTEEALCNGEYAPGKPQSVEMQEDQASNGEFKVAGKVMLADGVLKRNMGGRTEVLKVCCSEQERIEALEEYFRIYLTEEEKGAIKNFETELRG